MVEMVKMDEKLVVVGQGYVGLPLAMRAIESGFVVVGLELDHRRLELLKQGKSYVEDISSETVQAALSSGRYTPSDDASQCNSFDVAIITVPTPLRDGIPDLSFVERACVTLGPCLKRGSLVVLESTTYPGTTEDLVRPLLEKSSGYRAGPDFYLGYSPERIDPGNPSWLLQNTPKVIAGIDNSSLEAVKNFYLRIVDATVPVSSTRTAELTKILENTFRHVNIALVNELAMFASDLGIDVWEAISAASTKPFGFMPFHPGPGVGGHCLPVDPSYLSWRVKQTLGTPFRFIELANDINDHMPDYVVRRLIAGLNERKKPLNGSRVLVIGLSYKRNSGDARESPARVICQRLMQYGAEVRAVDPYLDREDFPSGVVPSELVEEEVVASDAVLVVTDHDCLAWDLIARHSSYVLDTRHRLSRTNNVEPL